MAILAISQPQFIVIVASVILLLIIGVASCNAILKLRAKKKDVSSDGADSDLISTRVAISIPAYTHGTRNETAGSVPADTHGTTNDELFGSKVSDQPHPCFFKAEDERIPTGSPATPSREEMFESTAYKPTIIHVDSSSVHSGLGEFQFHDFGLRGSQGVVRKSSTSPRKASWRSETES